MDLPLDHRVGINHGDSEELPIIPDENIGNAGVVDGVSRGTEVISQRLRQFGVRQDTRDEPQVRATFENDRHANYRSLHQSSSPRARFGGYPRDALRIPVSLRTYTRQYCQRTWPRPPWNAPPRRFDSRPLSSRSSAGPSRGASARRLSRGAPRSRLK
jgi:hypothetical protein